MEGTDVPGMQRNLRKENMTCGRISEVLAREGVPTLVVGNFYQAVVAAIFLYGKKMPVLSPLGVQALKGFRKTGMQPAWQTGVWVYPKSTDI